MLTVIKTVVYNRTDNMPCCDFLGVYILSIVKCKVCGAGFECPASAVSSCSICGAVQTFPAGLDEKISELYLRADEFRMAGEYEKAMGLYEFIISENSADAECYWRILLCRYGVSFRKDMNTDAVVLTVSRPQNRTVFNDKDYKSAVFYADEDSRRIYEAEATLIDEEQKKRFFTDSAGYIKTQQPPIRSKPVKNNTSVPVNNEVDAAASLKRGFIFLEDGKWINAKIYFEKVLDREPDNGEAYLGKLMADMQVKEKEMLRNCSAPFDANDNYRKLLRFADKKLAGEISDYNAYIKERNENSRLDKAYNDALLKFKNAKNEKDCLAAADAFSVIANHRDADELRAQCYKKIEQIKCEEKYNKALDKMRKKKKSSLLEAAELFKELASYKDSSQKAEECFALAKEIEEAKELKDKAYDKTLGGISRVCRILTAVALVIMVISVTLVSFVWPFAKYSKVEKLLNGGNMAAALDALESLNTFGNSDKKLAELLEECAVKEKSENPVYVMKDGTVFLFNGTDDKKSSFAVWDNIVQVSYDYYYIAGLTDHGTVLVSPIRESYSPEYIPPEPDWTDIVKISAGDDFIVGIDSDGEAYALTNSSSESANNACRVHDWHNIVDISAGVNHTVGLKKDGTVVSTDVYFNEGQDIVGEWENIAAVAAGRYNHNTVAITEDGYVVACGDNKYGQCDVSQWRNIVAVASGYRYTVGLKDDGTVLFTGSEEDFPGDVENIDWNELYNVNIAYMPEKAPEEEASVDDKLTSDEETTVDEETTTAEEETTAA